MMKELLKILPTSLKFISILIFLMNFILLTHTNRIYDEFPYYFYSQLCSLGQYPLNTTSTFNIATASPQLNIIRSALSVIEFSKDAYSDLDFQASITQVSSSNFLINLKTGLYCQMVYMGFFAVIIKQQPIYTPFIDLIQINIPPGSNLDSFLAGWRSETASTDVASTTIFPNANNLTCLQFSTSFTRYYIWASVNALDQKVIINTTFPNNTNIQSTVWVDTLITITTYSYFVLLFNKVNLDIYVATQPQFYYTYGRNTGLNQSFQITIPDFGSSFEHKCLIGYSQLLYNSYHVLQISITSYRLYSKGLIDYTGTKFIWINQTIPIIERPYFCLGQHFTCNQISNCLICNKNISSSSFFCQKCINGYYLSATLVSCNRCEIDMNFCSSCSSSANCLNCSYPYLVGLDNKCSKCVDGFIYSSGQCSINGCATTYTLPNGTIKCLSCLISEYYVYNQTSKVCLCDSGYSQTVVLSKKTCYSVCGDGIIISKTEECDDGNNINNDGCSSKCLTESNFICSGSPSSCILHQNFYETKYNYAYRVEGQNKVIFSLSILPPSAGLSKMDWSKIISFNFSSSQIQSVSYTYDPFTGEVQAKVNYLQDLEGLNSSISINFDSERITSVPSSQKIQFKMKGFNAPLILEDPQLLKTYKTVNVINYVVMALLLLQFYLASYYNKMIGLETLQIVQLFYFSRMVIDQRNTSILSSFNILKYSNGYSNGELFFDSSNASMNEKYTTLSLFFISIDLEKYFLLNVNISLFPLFLAICVYFISLVRRQRGRRQALALKNQEIKDKYTMLNRTALWIYDHIVFPLTMMLTFIAFFSAVGYLQSSNTALTLKQESNIQFSLSYSGIICILYLTFALYTYELLMSYISYQHSKLSSTEKLFTYINRLEHDENANYKVNYHLLYTSIYLIYYFCIVFCLSCQTLLPDINYKLEILVGLSFTYCIGICIYRPYNSLINYHNFGIIANSALSTLYLVVCLLFNKLQKISVSLYIVLIYVMEFLLCMVVFNGYLRITMEYRYQLKDNNRNRQQDQKQNDQSDKLLYNKGENAFLFENQLLQYKRKYQAQNLIPSEPLISKQEEDQYIIQRIRDEYKIYRNDFTDNTQFWNVPMRQHLFEHQQFDGKISKLPIGLKPSIHQLTNNLIENKQRKNIFSDRYRNL